MENERAWFEFLLHPVLLESHLNTPNPVPSAVDLMIQFIFNGMKRNEVVSPEVELADSLAQNIIWKKKRALAVLPLQIAAYLNWDLDFFQQKLPLQIQESLLTTLLQETLDDQYHPLNPDISVCQPHQLFSISLYHRFALKAIIQSEFPTKPPKVSNVPIPGQQDPSQESRDVQGSIVAQLENDADKSIQVLGQLFSAKEVRAPTLQTFSLSLPVNHRCPSDVHLWWRCILVPLEEFKCQINYDLGTYHFLRENYSAAFHHFSEALILLPEIGETPKFCMVSKDELKAYYASCASVCGRRTPIEKWSLYDRFQHSIHNKYENIAEILYEDNMTRELPQYLRKTMLLDMAACPEDLASGLLFQVHTLNTVYDVLHDEVWNNAYITDLLHAGKSDAAYLTQVLSSHIGQYTGAQKENIRNFIFTLNVVDGMSEVLAPALISCASLASLFTHEEILAMWPSGEKKMPAFDSSIGADRNDIVDITWDIIHSYDPEVLEDAVTRYLNYKQTRADPLKLDIMELNYKWDLPIPVKTTLKNLPNSPNRYLIFLCVVKAQELCLAKSFIQSLELLNHACSLTSKVNGSKEKMLLFQFLSWLILITKIQQYNEQLPCTDDMTVKELAAEAKQCLKYSHHKEGYFPWPSVVYWCLILLINVRDWDSFPAIFTVVHHYPFIPVAKALVGAAQVLRERSTNGSAYYELWNIVIGILVVCIQCKKNKSSSSQDRDEVRFLDFVKCVKEPTCLSILISLLGHAHNIHAGEASAEVHIDHRSLWPDTLGFSDGKDILCETLSTILDHATKQYATPSPDNAALSASWHVTKGDLAYHDDKYQSAMRGYLTAIFISTDYLRNDIDDESILSETVVRRMIRSCMNLSCYTQAAVLCQFLDCIDYTTALRCLQERNAVDGIDTYYDCLWDVTLIEYVISLHQKKGEFQRQDKAIKVIGLLEINSNNNEEIQHEAAKVRRHRFLRALGKLYL